MPDWRDIYPDKRIITLILDPAEADELLAQAIAEGRRIGERTIMGMPMIAFGPEPDPAMLAPAKPATGRPVDPVDLDSWRSLGRKIEHRPDAAGTPDDKVVILPVVRRAPLQDKASEPDKPAGETPESPQPAPNQPPAPAPDPARAKPPEPVSVTITGRKDMSAETRSAVGRMAGLAARQLAADRTPTAEAGRSRCSILDDEPPASQPPPAEEPKRRFNKAKSRWETRGQVSAADRELIDKAIAEGRVTRCPDYKFSVEPGQLLPGEGWKKPKKGKKPAR